MQAPELKLKQHIHYPPRETGPHFILVIIEGLGIFMSI